MEQARPGEFELIARLTAGLSSVPGVVLGVGDDCAVLDTGGDMLLLATCDSQVEGVHFTFEAFSPGDIGRKALAINISDIAAMGGEPHYALISLILPAQLSNGLLGQVYAGLRQEAQQFGIAIVGGNISGAGRGTQLVIDITLLGSVERGHVLLRSGARVGDTLCVTGAPGQAAAAVYVSLHPAQSYPSEVSKALRTIRRVPQPRVREGRILGQLGPQVVTAMLDVSDGLSGDLQRICERSRAGARIQVAQIPLSPALRTIASAVGHDPLDWALHGGEDYELLFSVSPGHESEVAHAVLAATGTPVTPIGTIIPPGEGMKLAWPDGHEELLVPRSWDHLRQS